MNQLPSSKVCNHYAMNSNLLYFEHKFNLDVVYIEATCIEGRL